MSNPHRHVRQLIRTHRRAEQGALASLGYALAPVAVGALIAPLFRPIFLHFLDAPDPHGEGLFGVVIRLCLVVIGLLSIDTYGALIRSADRHVLAVLPVDPGQVATQELADVVRSRVWVPLVAGLLLLPVGLSTGWLAWGLAVGVVVGACVVGVTVSAAVHLLAVSAAEDPRLAGWLDLIRGGNPREQAAFLYAPGVALAVAGLPVLLATEGMRRAVHGSPEAALALVFPFAVAVFAWSRLPSLARQGWFRASAVLADIDARYAAVEESEEATSAYLDWMPRFLPADLARYALKDLRHGWRGRRTWISAMWGVGLLAGMASWSGSASAPGRGLVIGILGIWLTAVVGVLMERDEPDFLRAWLPEHRGSRMLARTVVLASWLQPAVWLPAVALAIRHGLGSAGMALLFGEGAVAGAALLVAMCMQLRERGVLAYGPMAAVAGSVLALLAAGGSS